MAVLFEFHPFKWEVKVESYHPFNRPDKWPHRHTHIHFGPLRLVFLRGSTLFGQACQAVHHGTEANFSFMGDMQAQANERQKKDLEWAAKTRERIEKTLDDERTKTVKLQARVRELEECLRVLKTIPEVGISVLLPKTGEVAHLAPPEPPTPPKGPEPVEIKP